jgi:hypothetical protein
LPQAAQNPRRPSACVRAWRVLSERRNGIPIEDGGWRGKERGRRKGAVL